MAKYRKYSNEFKLQAAKWVAEQGHTLRDSCLWDL